MQTMQAVIGYGVLTIIVLIALVGSVALTDKLGVKGAFKRLGTMTLWFLAIVVVCYAALAIVGGLFWAIAWIGMFLRGILQWLIESMFYPFHHWLS